MTRYWQYYHWNQLHRFCPRRISSDTGINRGVQRMMDVAKHNWHSLCVQVQRSKEEGGLDGNVLYIDTENTFRPERIVSIANANGMDPEKVLDRIIVASAYNSAHQTLILEESGPVIKEHNVKLLIADSAVGLFRAEYLGRGTLSAMTTKIKPLCTDNLKNS